jgi:mannose-6-phosphate isomerase-like protein (cupin superfamily)
MQLAATDCFIASLSSRDQPMRFYGLVVFGVLVMFQSTKAQDENAAVPVEKAFYHLPVYHNDYVIMIDAYIPPGRKSNWHTHSLDEFSVAIQSANQTAERPGVPLVSISPSKVGTVSFKDYSTAPITHRGGVLADSPTSLHNILMVLLKPGPAGFAAGMRDGAAGYSLVIENKRLRAWRLVLEPGEASGEISQTSPGVRIVVSGGEIIEAVSGSGDRKEALRSGEFFWQDAGVTRIIRNDGKTRIELVEVELK